MVARSRSPVQLNVEEELRVVDRISIHLSQVVEQQAFDTIRDSTTGGDVLQHFDNGIMH
jgi:hypothetical protein